MCSTGAGASQRARCTPLSASFAAPTSLAVSAATVLALCSMAASEASVSVGPPTCGSSPHTTPPASAMVIVSSNAWLGVFCIGEKRPPEVACESSAGTVEAAQNGAAAGATGCVAGVVDDAWPGQLAHVEPQALLMRHVSHFTAPPYRAACVSCCWYPHARVWRTRPQARRHATLRYPYKG